MTPSKLVFLSHVQFFQWPQYLFLVAFNKVSFVHFMHICVLNIISQFVRKDNCSQIIHNFWSIMGCNEKCPQCQYLKTPDITWTHTVYFYRTWKQRKKKHIQNKDWQGQTRGQDVFSPMFKETTKVKLPCIFLSFTAVVNKERLLTIYSDHIQPLEDNTLRATQSKGSEINRWISSKLTHDLCLHRNLFLFFFVQNHEIRSFV